VTATATKLSYGRKARETRSALFYLNRTKQATALTSSLIPRGSGVTVTLLQAAELLALVDEHGADMEAVGCAFDAWCEAAMRPWVEDHVRMDEDQRRRWEGGDIDLAEHLPSNLIMAAAEVDPKIGPALGPYLQMTAGPACLDGVEAPARAVDATGWRPRLTEGPTRSELADLVASTLRL
jgi:hypothetical protein